MLDLEKVAHREAIERSHDLRLALDTARLHLCSAGVVSNRSKPEIVERVIEKRTEEHHHHEKKSLDEDRLMSLMRQVMKEQSAKAIQHKQAANNSQILEAMAVLQQKIEAMGSGESYSEGPPIDPAVWANLQSKAIDQISKGIEGSHKAPGKRVVLKNTGLSELANELD